jgi:hypothetical protein
MSMRRPSLTLLAGGLLGLMVTAPVLAGDPLSPSQAPPPSTTTTAPYSSDSPPSQEAACNPETNHAPAPEVGATESYPAGDAGSVDIKRSSASDLEVAKVNPNPEWTPETTAQTGPRVKVRFTNNADPNSIVRFAAQMDQAGTEIHIRVTSCQ